MDHIKLTPNMTKYFFKKETEFKTDEHRLTDRQIGVRKYMDGREPTHFYVKRYKSGP